MNYQHIVEEEYVRQKLSPVYCSVLGESFAVPLSYKGDVNAFVDDLLTFQDNRFNDYADYNSHHPENPLVVRDIEVDGVHLIPSVRQALKKLSDKEIIRRNAQTAQRRYNAAIKKVIRARREYPDKNFAATLDSETLYKYDRLHTKYCLGKIRQGLQKTFKWTTKQAVNMLAGVAGAVPAAAYYMLDKKVHFAKNKTTSFISTKALPYIRKGLIKSMIPLAIAGGIKKCGHDKTPPQDVKQRIAVDAGKDDAVQTTKDSNTNMSKKYLSQKYKITDEASFKKLFDDAFPLLIKSMLPTEIYVGEAYSDNGKCVNTAGIGSWWYPANGDPTSSEWIPTSQYVKEHKDLKVSGELACALAKGWFCSRDGGRVYRDMFKLLKGAELNVCEFSAVASCMYNDEANGKKLCDYVQKHYKYSVDCAAFLAGLKPGNSAFDDGIKKRHIHEALFYLNLDGYAERVPYLQVKKGVNSKGCTFYVTSVYQLNPDECDPAIEGLRNGSVVELRKVGRKICKYRCKDGQPVWQIIAENNMELDKEFKTVPLDIAADYAESEVLYKQALAKYNSGDYDGAIKGFQRMIDKGDNGADIYNDMAITYYNMGEYEKCIAACHEVLKTGETEQYAATNYNAGKAYEKLHNPNKALQNYQLALEREPDNKVYQAAVKRLQPAGADKKNGSNDKAMQKHRQNLSRNADSKARQAVKRQQRAKSPSVVKPRQKSR